MQREELQASGIDCELSEKDSLIEVLCEQENSFSTKERKKSDDKEAAEEVRKKNQVNLRQVARKKPGEVVAMGLNS